MTKKSYHKVVAQNRRAHHDYFIEETLEAGIVLVGSEVKSLRDGRANITDSHADTEKNELFLYNSYIPEYKGANRFNHEPRRPRKLLLNRKQIKKWMGKTKMKGYTIVALSIYFNNHNKAKVELGLAKGKKEYDKRATIKQKDWDREKERLIKEKYIKPSF